MFGAVDLVLVTAGTARLEGWQREVRGKDGEPKVSRPRAGRLGCPKETKDHL